MSKGYTVHASGIPIAQFGEGRLQAHAPMDPAGILGLSIADLSDMGNVVEFTPEVRRKGVDLSQAVYRDGHVYAPVNGEEHQGLPVYTPVSRSAFQKATGTKPPTLGWSGRDWEVGVD